MGQAAAGAQLEDKYFLQKVKLGQGSFGTVWRAVERQSGNVVAIKQLDKATLPRRGVKREDIEREIEMMKACDHENITQLFDTFEDACSISLALEYCDGGDFGDKVKERGMTLPEAECADWVRQMCSAIKALHAKSICHRDIKPDNFMVKTQEGGITLKLSDFGLAIFLPKGKLLSEKCGTPAFMAPEQHNLPKRSKGYTFPADVWALGISMYMVMFGGKHPFMTDRGALDDKLLLQGELDFRENADGGFFNFAMIGHAKMRYSDAARLVCKGMVDPNPATRLNADDALRIDWLAQARRPQGQTVGQPPGPDVGMPPHPGQPPPPGPTQMPQGFPPPGNAQPVPTAPEMRQLREENKVLKQRTEEQQKALADWQMQQQYEQQQMMWQMQQMQHQAQQNHFMAIQQQQQQHQQQQYPQQQYQQQQYQQQQQAMSDQRKLQKRKTAFPQEQTPEDPGRPDNKVVKCVLSKGSQCRYYSSTYKWVPSVVEGFNEDDGTYNLANRLHAQPHRIAPPANDLASASTAWPHGTTVFYYSTSANTWIPGYVVSFNESDTSYNLDVRDHADIERIRARVGNKPFPSDDAHGQLEVGRQPSGLPQQDLDRVPSGAPQQELGRQPSGAPQQELGRQPSGASRYPEKIVEDRDGSAQKPMKIADLEVITSSTNDSKGSGGLVDSSSASSARDQQTLPPQRVPDGAWATTEKHGFVRIETFNRATGEVAISYSNPPQPPQRTSVKMEQLRAPGDASMSWPPKTAVFYDSESHKKSFEAVIHSFNAKDGRYNLDVKENAVPERIHPRCP